MKKLVITLAAVAFAAVAAQAQSVGAEVRVADAAWRGTLTPRTFAQNRVPTQKQATVEQKVTNKVERAVVKQEQQNKNAKAPAKKPAAKKAPAKQAPKTNKKGTTPKKRTSLKQNGSMSDWLIAAMGGKYPNETSEEYRARLSVQSQPSSLPFK